MENTETQTHAASIMDKATCLSVEIRRPGIRRKVSSQQVETDADKDMIHVSKDLIESDAYQAIVKRDNRFRTDLAALALPSLFRAGIVLIPDTLIDRADRLIENFCADRLVMVENFIAEYPAAIEAAATRLGSLHNSLDYKSAERMRAAFAVDANYIEIGTPGKLKKLNKAAYDRAIAKAEQRIANLATTVEDALRGEFASLIDHALDRLGKKADGSQKVFRNSLVGNIKDFLDVFKDKNITDDQALAALVGRVEELIDGVNPDDLRTNEQMREYVQTGFTGAKAELDKMLIDRPSRVIDFADASA